MGIIDETELDDRVRKLAAEIEELNEERTLIEARLEVAGAELNALEQIKAIWERIRP
jgi:chromosome segregation ATPase